MSLHMIMLKSVSFTVLLLCGCYTTEAASVHNAHSTGADNVPVTVGVLVASLSILICCIFVLMLCTDFCQKHSGFKDFDNDAFTEDSLPPVPAPTSEFTMYPPVENTPDSLSATPIVFEPLPDLTPRVEQRQHLGNAWRLRPRLIHQGQARSESLDSLDQVIQNDSVQQKLKLQNLLTNSRHQVPRSQLQYIKELGNGWFGKVLQGEGHNILPGHKKTKVVIQMLKEETDRQDQLAFLEEAISYRETDHQNVLRLLGQCVDTEPFLNVMELCPFGDLKTYLRSHRVAMESFNEKGLPLKFACDMAAGLQALHQEGFIHRDFSTRNCLLASDLSVKVGDYGLSEETFREDYYIDRHGDAIPIRWLAPESLQVTSEDVYVRRIDKQANIWTYGIALWEVMTFGALPYSDLTNSHVLRLVVVEKSVRLRRPDVHINNLDRLYQLLQLCWSDPEHRPSLRELRIMLLHLLSRKDSPNTTAFDQKWNQLMPRRSPRVVRATPSPSNLPQPNGGVKTITGMDLPQTTGGMSSASSVLSGEDGDGGFNELNASQLGLAGSRGIQGKAGTFNEKPVQPTSPVNEMSLEAEFSAANMAAVQNSDSEEDDLFVDTPKQTGGEKLVSADDFLSPIALDAGMDSSKDDSVGDGSHVAGAMPDVVATSAMSPLEQVKGNFATSTPKKVERDSETDLYTTALGGSTVCTSSERSHATGTYHTAPSIHSSVGSIDKSLSVEYEDRSFMGTKKFADMLQTVAMSTSLDEDTSSEVSPMPFDITEEDVFKSVASPDGYGGKLVPIGKIDLEEDVSGSGENTPRNTPTPPVATSSMPLLDASDLSDVAVDESSATVEAQSASQIEPEESTGEILEPVTLSSLGSVGVGEESSPEKEETVEQSSPVPESNEEDKSE